MPVYDMIYPASFTTLNAKERRSEQNRFVLSWYFMNISKSLKLENAVLFVYAKKSVWDFGKKDGTPLAAWGAFSRKPIWTS